jgi:two-component system OmpR family sensor kinase
MTLRTRLLLVMAGLLAVALLATGALVVAFTRANLVELVDQRLLLSGRDRFDRIPELAGDPDDPAGRSVAVLIVGPEGTTLAAVPSGTRAAPDPLPVVPSIRGGVIDAPLGTVFEGRSEDGSVAYRMLAERGERGFHRILAAPLTEIGQATAALIRNLLVVGALVLAAALGIGWWLIRRGLQPLEAIAGTASRISAGDLSERVAVGDPGTEVGRVGTAVNTMLDDLQAAFDAQQAALEAKDRSERRLRRFVADASHELRTPLTAIRGYAELYRSGGLADPPTLDAAMGRIDTESRRMTALTEDLLLLARLDQGRPLERRPVDLSAVVGDAVADLRVVEAGRPVVADIATAVVVTGDEDRLRQVVGNLLANVRVHTPPATPVEVVLSVEGDPARAVLRVVDHGPGIPVEHEERVFDRFYRADPSRARDHGGSGLGLAIANSVLAAHDGTIAHAPTPGGGASFTVTLPLGEPTTISQ